MNMHRDYLIKTIRTALQRASGKPLDEAAVIVADYIGMVDEILSDIPVPIVADTAKDANVRIQTSVSSLVPVPIEVAAAMPPISLAELRSDIESGLPADIEVALKEGQNITLRRYIESLDEGSYLVAYRPDGATDTDPCPRLSFFASNGRPDCKVATANIVDLAKKIYGHPITKITNKTPLPQGIQWRIADS